MDFIGEALKKIKVAADSVGRLEVCTPWQVEGGRGLPVAYYFLRGQGEIALNAEAHHIEAGDLIFVPRGDKHIVHDGSTTITSPPSLAVETQKEAVGRSYFLHVTIQAEIGGDCPFISALPSLLILKAGERTDCPYLDSHLQSLVWESATCGPASELLLARLWEVVFLLAFRTYLSQATHHTTGWLAAIRDPQLARALSVIQQQPHVSWTVERLAEEAAMSRATFTRQFVRVLGEPPMKFLYLHRMGVAASLLQQGESNIAAIAARVGYGSEAAFSNAFRRHFGSAPGAYRAAITRTHG